jgi:hypothetical protein
VAHVEGMGRDTVTAADVLVAIFDEKESHAVWLLAEQEMTQQDTANIIAQDNPQVSQRRNTQPVVKRRARKRSKPAGQWMLRCLLLCTTLLSPIQRMLTVHSVTSVGGTVGVRPHTVPALQHPAHEGTMTARPPSSICSIRSRPFPASFRCGGQRVLAGLDGVATKVAAGSSIRIGRCGDRDGGCAASRSR